MIPLLRMAEEIAVKRAGDGNLSRRKVSEIVAKTDLKRLMVN